VKRECFQCMGMDGPRWWGTPHAVARFMVFRREIARACEHWQLEQFLTEWLQHATDRQCQTFDFDPAIQLGGPHGDGPEFAFRDLTRAGSAAHRTEQAVYSLLCQKYGRRLHREACEFGNQCRQDWQYYPQLFHQEGRHGPHTEQGSAFRERFPVGGAV